MSYKFKIENAEQSKRVQKILFDLGYRWIDAILETEPINTDKPYIYAGVVNFNLIQYGISKDAFESSPAKEIDVSWLTPKPTHTIDIQHGMEVYSAYTDMRCLIVVSHIREGAENTYALLNEFEVITSFMKKDAMAKYLIMNNYQLVERS